MLLRLLAKIAADFAPAALILFVASTHRVASEFELLAEKVSNQQSSCHFA